MNHTTFSYYKNCFQDNPCMNYFHSYFGNTVFDLSLPKEDYNISKSYQTPQEFPLNLSVTNVISEPQMNTDEDMPIDYSLPKVHRAENTNKYYNFSDPNLNYLYEKRKRVRTTSETDSEDSTILQIDEEVNTTEKECSSNNIKEENTPTISKEYEINKLETNITTKHLNTKRTINSSEQEQTLLSAHRTLIEKYQQQIQQHSSEMSIKEICERRFSYSESSSYKNNCRFTHSDGENSCSVSCNSDHSSQLSYSQTKKLSTNAREWESKCNKGSCKNCVITRKRKIFKQKRLNSYFANLMQNQSLKSRKTNSSKFYSSSIEDKKNSANCERESHSNKFGNNEDHSYYKKVPDNLPEFPLVRETETFSLAETRTKVTSKLKKQCKRCSLCLNHGVITKMRGHIGNCQYQFCKCERCLITKARQLHMLRQQRLTRQIQREKKKQ